MEALPLPGSSYPALLAELAAVDDPARLPALAASVHQRLGEVADGRLDGETATRLISTVNDRLTAKTIALVARRQRLPPAAWCWLAMGSEGRDEQTLAGDQDNGLVFAASDGREAQALRERFLPFAEAVNAALADCGFPRCPGGIMAGNPAWCLSLAEWREQFFDWVRCPEPAALLNASIFFDLRPLAGSFALGDALRDEIARLCADAPAFQHLMAANALQAQPPLGFLGDVTVDDPEGIDLKKFGSRIFVDAARIFALANGCKAVNSFARLRQAGPAAGMQAREVAAAGAALGHLLRLRLAAQQGGAVLLQPAALHDVDRAILRESLHQARHLQQRLKLNYSL